MKIQYFIYLISAAVLAACAPDHLRPEPEPKGLLAVIDADLPATRSILVDNPGVKLESYWQAGDEIGVFGGSAGNVLFQLKESSLSSNRKTAEFQGNDAIPSGKLTAYAPYSKDARKDGEAIVVNFPAGQRYVTSNGVAAPDPSAHFLLGEGTKNGGLTFRAVAAVLKIGQVFGQATIVKTVEFRDLSGAAISGTMKLTPGNAPTGEITGNGTVLTLDLGEGLEYPEGEMRPLFLIVPARNYPRGFEITFIDDKGGKTVRTVGTAQGKKLERGVVYLIGDISGQSYVVDAKTELYEGATIMTPELLDKVTLVDADMRYLYDANGKVSTDRYGVPIRKPVLTMIMHKDLHPVVGHWLIFEQPTATLPEGGIYKITACEPYGDSYRVTAKVEENIAAPFKEVTVGSPIYDEAGNLLEDGGELDLASHLQAILDADGNPVPFSISPSGNILLSEEETAAMLGLVETRGIMHKTFTPPKMTFKHSEKNAEVSFGAQAKLHCKLAVRMMGGELQYIHFTANPVFELSAEFVLKAEFDFSQEFHLFQLIITPFPVAPGILVTPTIDFSGKVGVGGSIQFSTSVSYTYDMGMYGLSYNRGDGITARHQRPPATETEIQPSMDGFSGSLYAYGQLTAAPYLSIYGMLGLGVEAGFSLKFGLGYEDKTQSSKLFLTPELELIPSIAVLGGYLTKRFSDLTTNVAFDPIWEKYLSPKVILASTSYVSIPLSEKFYDFPTLADDEDGSMSMQVTKSPKKWSYNVELSEETPIDYEVQVRVYESSGKVDNEFYFIWSDVPEGFSVKPFKTYLEAGIPHMYPYLDDIRNPDNFSDVPASPRLVTSHTVGIYSAGMKGQTFEGQFSGGTVTSGHAYWSSVHLVHGSAEKIIGRSRFDRVYYWPTDYYGAFYKESDIQDFHGSGNGGGN